VTPAGARRLVAPNPVEDDDAVTVRALLIGAGGAAATVVAFALSGRDDGFAGAALFMLALFAIPVIVGGVIAARANAAPRTPHRIIRRSAAARVFPDLETVEAVRCRTCGSRRSLHGAVWVCTICDQV
jgi:hypothetical protein